MHFARRTKKTNTPDEQIASASIHPSIILLIKRSIVRLPAVLTHRAFWQDRVFFGIVRAHPRHRHRVRPSGTARVVSNRLLQCEFSVMLGSTSFGPDSFAVCRATTLSDRRPCRKAYTTIVAQVMSAAPIHAKTIDTPQDMFSILSVTTRPTKQTKLTATSCTTFRTCGVSDRFRCSSMPVTSNQLTRKNANGP